MGITMKIHNIKSISDFTFEIPTAKGLYALTGENAAGKSTVISCIATAFYSPLLRKSEAELIEVTVEYLFSNENAEIKELTQFLEKELATTR